MEETSILVKKICWAYNDFPIHWPGDIQSLAHCQKLEDEGFGILADIKNPEKMDISESIVCPDGRVFTPEQIENYWDKKGNIHYSSENPEDVKMHKARMYYLGFKG
jgi:hypothetical protein